MGSRVCSSNLGLLLLHLIYVRLYFLQLRLGGEYKMCWSILKKGVSQVKSFYEALVLEVQFSDWMAVLGKILSLGFFL